VDRPVALRHEEPEHALVMGAGLDDSTFTHFSASVAVTVTGAQSLERSDIVRAMYYRIDRTLLPSQVWKTIASFDSATPFGRPTPGGISTIDIASAVTTSDGGVAVLYDRQGNALAAPKPVALDSLINGRAQFDSPERAKIPAFPSRPSTGTIPYLSVMRGDSAGASTATAASAQAPADPRAWVREFVVTPHRRARARAAIAAALGAPVGMVGALERYTTRHGRELHEQLFDPVTGVLAEENVVEDGVLRVHTQHRYATLANGTMVRVGTHTELGMPGGAGQRAVIDVRYSNLRLDNSGGAQ
jgi:hypothetical protein